MYSHARSNDILQIYLNRHWRCLAAAAVRRLSDIAGAYRLDFVSVWDPWNGGIAARGVREPHYGAGATHLTASQDGTDAVSVKV